MRSGLSYRAARRAEAKATATAMGDSFTLAWQNGRFRYMPADVEKYRPSIRRRPGKIYAVNGKRECARRLRQMEA